MTEPILHAFVSVKSDSPDTSLVSSSEWNDGHIFGGGLNGQLLVYDNTQPNNMRWTDGVKTNVVSLSITTSTVTPINDTLLINFTTTSAVKGLSIIYIGDFTTVGNATMVLNHNIDNIVGFQPIVLSPQINPLSFTTDINIPTPGAHSVSVDLVVAGNANILTVTMSQRLILFGV